MNTPSPVTLDPIKNLRAPFKQSEALAVLRMQKRVDGSADGGICDALSWNWLRRIHCKLDRYATAEARMDACWKDKTLDHAVERHNDVSKNFLLFLEELYGIDRKKIAHSYAFSYLEVFTVVGCGGGVHLAFTCPLYNNEKHAIAIYAPPPSHQRIVHVFDANEGEFELPTAHFGKWLEQFLVTKYGATFDDVTTTCSFPAALAPSEFLLSK